MFGHSLGSCCWLKGPWKLSRQPETTCCTYWIQWFFFSCAPTLFRKAVRLRLFVTRIKIGLRQIMNATKCASLILMVFKNSLCSFFFHLEAVVGLTSSVESRTVSADRWPDPSSRDTSKAFANEMHIVLWTTSAGN